jgi:hypothetical protein
MAKEETNPVKQGIIKAGPVDLKKRVVCTVTKKGHDHKSNKWKEGQEIIVGSILAKKFEADGLVKITGEVVAKKK